MDFLEKTVLEKKKDTSINSNILVILPDDIAIKNFNRALLLRELPSSGISMTTVDDLAERVVDPERKRMVRILENHILTQLIINEINTVSSGPLSAMKSIPLKEPNTQESLIDEFNEFLRATDAGTLSSYLIDAAMSLHDPFASMSSMRFLEAFKHLEQTLMPKVEAMGDNIFYSRGHLLKKARDALESSWPPILEVNEVLISNISVFDASVLKLIERIDQLGKKTGASFKMRVFIGIGTYPILKERLTKAHVMFEEEIDSQNPVCNEEAKLLDDFSEDALKFVAAPERRREIEYVANSIHELLLHGVSPSEILVVARNCGVYLNLVSEIFSAYGIAYHVQTRRPYAHLSPYRFLKATTELIVAAQSGMVTWDQITDPLRLGFCLPYGRSTWPVQPREFIYLEECLSRVQSKMHDTPLPLAEWQTKANTEIRFQSARIVAEEFLRWIQQQVVTPPKDSRDARYLLSELLEQYMLQASTWTRRASSLRVTNPERFKINEVHPTHFASRMRSDRDFSLKHTLMIASNYLDKQ